MSTNVNLKKRTFIDDLMFHLGKLPDGSGLYRKKVKLILIAISNDLAYLNILPMFVRNLDATDIVKLVAHWQQQGLQAKTISNRLSILRKILSRLEHPKIIASNRDLGVIVKPKALSYIQKQAINPYHLPAYAPFLIKEICILQYLFGLKMSEAIRIDIGMVYPLYLEVPRTISFNKKDRIVRINSEAQKAFLKKFNDEFKHHLPVPRIHSPYFKKTFEFMLQEHQINHIDYFRHLYIQKRYHELKNIGSAADALKTVTAEVGYSRLDQTKGVLLCLENF